MMRVARPKRNPKVQIEALVRLLLDPLERKKRQDLLELPGTQPKRLDSGRTGFTQTVLNAHLVARD
jgi:hypothetical protein